MKRYRVFIEVKHQIQRKIMNKENDRPCSSTGTTSDADTSISSTSTSTTLLGPLIIYDVPTATFNNTQEPTNNEHFSLPLHGLETSTTSTMRLQVGLRVNLPVLGLLFLNNIIQAMRTVVMASMAALAKIYPFCSFVNHQQVVSLLSLLFDNNIDNGFISDSTDDVRLSNTYTNNTNTNTSICNEQKRLGITIVCISDTHGEHRKLTKYMPSKADILIHAGDFTKFGKQEHIQDFNQWLSTLPYNIKIVVNGNHESNAMWKSHAKTLLNNAHLLIDETIRIKIDSQTRTCQVLDNDSHHDTSSDNHNGLDNTSTHSMDKDEILYIHGTNFYWPTVNSQSHNPYFDLIHPSTDILISHCPVLGYVDQNHGCPALKQKILKEMVMNRTSKIPTLVISGHIHDATGIQVQQIQVPEKSMNMTKKNIQNNITFVNAANAKRGHSVGKKPIVLTL